MTDYYAVLGVEPDATADIIKRAYRTLARRYHPDRNKAAEAEERFKAVAEAYAVLSNPAQREQYDQARRMAGAGQGEHWDAGVDSELFNEIFSRIFSSGSEPGAGRTYANQTFASDLFGQGVFGGGVSQPAPVDIELTLEEAHAGVLRTLAVTDPLGGERTVRRVRIPAGARPGQVLRIPLGKGEEPLRVRIRLTPHADYTWVGDQLVKNLAVTPWEAALGARMTIDTLGGRVALRIPAGSEAGRMLRVTGKGFAGGDLLVRLAIDAPMATTDEQRRAYEALRRSFDRCA